MPTEIDDSVVVAATPEISVFINTANQLSIRVLEMCKESGRVEDYIVSIPMKYVQAVAEAMKDLA